jgi:uncharacterized membrane protein YobD (UPF0266 family)
VFSSSVVLVSLLDFLFLYIVAGGLCPIVLFKKSGAFSSSVWMNNEKFVTYDKLKCMNEE